MSKHREWNWYTIVAILLTIIGLIILILFLVKLSVKFTINGNDILLTETAQVGDFIGGLVGSIWALAGVLLFFSALKIQREELKLQRQEFKEQRLEFVTSRVTTIIYKQKETFEAKLYDKKVELTIKDEKYSGFEAFNKIKELKMKFFLPRDFHDLPDEDQRIIRNVSDFFFSHHGEELLSVIHTTFFMIHGFISEKDDNNDYILDEFTRRQLFTLMRSMFRFREIEEFIISVRAIWHHLKQDFVGVPPALEHFARVESMSNDIRKLIHVIITEDLKESKYEFGHF